MLGSTAVVFLALLAAQVVAEAEEWTKLTSPSFELYTTAGVRQGKNTIQYFEQVRSFFAQAVQFQPRPAYKIRIVGFSNEKQYAPFRPNQTASAFYQAGPDRDYIVMRDLAYESYHVVVHEYVHLLIRHAGIQLPVWLNEGFAELYSTMRPVGNKVLVGEFHPGRYGYLMSNRWMPLEQLTAVDQRSPDYNEKNRSGIFYAQSWALTHLLNLNEYYRPKVSEFLKLVHGGEASAVAFQTVYGRTLARVTQDLQSYMRGSSYTVGSFDIKLEKLAESPEVKPNAEAEAKLVQAQLHLLGRRRELARTMLESVAPSLPGSSEIPETLGYMHLWDQEYDQAVPLLSKAMELGSKTPRLRKDLAFLYQRAGQAERSLAMMKKVVEENPNSLDDRLQLGRLLLAAGKNSDAMSLLTEVKRVRPDKAVQLFRLLAYCYLQLKSKENARLYITRALEYATEQEKAELERLLGWVNQPEYQAEAPLLIHMEPERPKSAQEELAGTGDRIDFRKSPDFLEGKLEHVDCLGEQARISVVSDGKRVQLLIEDPNLVKIHGQAGTTVEFTCGVQKGNAVKVGYTAGKGAHSTEGLVHSIEFQ